MERRAIEIQPELMKDKSIRGVAAVWYSPSDPGTQFGLNRSTVERIMSTAFDRSISDGTDIIAVFNHDPSMILGRSSSGLKLTKTSRGLEYEIPSRKTRIYKEIREHIENGDVIGSSFQFQPVEIRASRDGEMKVREVWGAKLIDISPVTRPAYSSTEAYVRSWWESSPECRALQQLDLEEAEKQAYIRAKLEHYRLRLRILELD
jgi:hypothetical protein